ncbi:MAG: alpha-L-glutamate ligase-like protein [Phycisphaeraceae bacterium]|nr:alpha-L-glutamate ligase-like protein [Phycisphaeraceae bacterium]
MLTWPWKLKQQGVMGINARNHRLIQPLNPRARYPLVDNKRLTKQALEKWDIPTPPGIAVVEHHHDIRRIDEQVAERNRFVIKPCNGSGGKGILVLIDRCDEGYVRPNGSHISPTRLRGHLANILSGLYSLTGRPDAALVEDCIDFTEHFERFTHKGVPDLRVIVYRGYPLVAMMRLPTSSADGKANLHQGAVGVGLDLSTGQAIHACRGSRPCDRHPDTDAPISELSVPQWQQCLEHATRCYEMAGLGYFGADIVHDVDRGPVILELNARPGLSIQLATDRGLSEYLAVIDDLPHDPLPSPKRRVELAQQAQEDCFS